MEKELFFMRDPWVYDSQSEQFQRPDSNLGFDTRALHAGYHPLGDMEQFRAFLLF